MTTKNKKVTLQIEATITNTEVIDKEGQKVKQATFVITDPGWPEFINVPRLQGTTELDPNMPDTVAELAITECATRDLLQFVALGIIAEFKAQEEQRKKEWEMYAEIGRRYVEMRKEQEEKEQEEKAQEEKAQEEKDLKAIKEAVAPLRVSTDQPII